MGPFIYQLRKNGSVIDSFLGKRGLIVYLAALKKGAIRGCTLIGGILGRIIRDPWGLCCVCACISMNTYQICMLFVSDSKLNIILKSDIKKERKFNFFIYYIFIQNFRDPLGSHLGSSG